MKEEKSCGAVVYRKHRGEIQVLLIRHVNGGHWAFPKGHVEKKESEEETALREIREETGLKVRLKTDFRESVRYSPKPGVMKDVIYFAAKAKKHQRARHQEQEVADARWLGPKDALDLVTYENDRSVLKAFLKYRKKKAKKK